MDLSQLLADVLKSFNPILAIIGIQAPGEGTGTVIKIWNNILYDWGTGISCVTGSSVDDIIIYNNTLYNCDRAVDTNDGAIVIQDGVNDKQLWLKNNLVFGTTECYQIAAFTILITSNNVSSDQSSPDTAFRGITINFNDAANGDFRLSSSSGTGVDVSNDADGKLNITTYADGSARVEPSECGALPIVAAAAIIKNTPNQVISGGD